MDSDDIIINVVRELQRTYGRVFPWQVQMHLPFRVSVGYTRNLMVKLWYEGRLHRIGGASSRRGYQVAVVRVPRLRVVSRGKKLRVA